LFALSINSDSVLGMICPISSTRSPHRNPSVKTSIALSLETSTAEFFMMLHLWMYDLSVSLHCCMQALTSSIFIGRLYVDLKLLVIYFVSSSQIPIVSLSNLLNHSRVAPVRWSYKLCIVVSFDPPSILTACWYVSNVSIIFDAPCLFMHHLLCVLLHFVAFLCIF
jgi:hypothetical protein